MPTLSSTIQTTRSKFAIAKPRAFPSHQPLSFRCTLAQTQDVAAAPAQATASLTNSSKASIVQSRRFIARLLNFFLKLCVLQAEEVCDGSRWQAAAPFSSLPDLTDYGWRDHPLQQLA